MKEDRHEQEGPLESRHIELGPHGDGTQGFWVSTGLGAVNMCLKPRTG